MAASTPLVNSPRVDLGRHPDLPFMSRHKRSDSHPYDGVASRAHYDPVSHGRYHPYVAADAAEDSTFVPTSLSEHLLERTYLDDVVRPLVRALVKARMTYSQNGEAGAESSQAYADLEKLRRELERSAQRARHAEQERDDLARRLDLAGVPDAPMRDRNERFVEHMGPAEHAHPGSRNQPPSAPSLLGIKRPRPGEAEPIRNSYDPRSCAPGSTGVSVNVPHGEGSASITVTTEGPSGPPISLVSRPHHGPVGEQMSPPTSYSVPGAPRHRGYPDAHHEPHDGEPRHLTRMPLTNAALEAEYAYADERAERYGMSAAAAAAAHRPGMARYPGMGGRSPPASSSYLTSGSERSSMPTLTTYPSTSSASSFSAATPYSTTHYEHEMDELERSRKLARLRAGDGSMDHAAMAGARAMGTPANYMLSPSEAGGYPVRKLASTKNRTCSNCSAPHDAKFRRGPNGPGTLCDRCGSRWKKFKEQESASKREHDSAAGALGTPGASAAASAGAAAQARLSSASSSSQSPRDAAAPQAEAARASDADPATAEVAANGRLPRDASADLAPTDAASNRNHREQREQREYREHRERERSASVDQLIDD